MYSYNRHIDTLKFALLVVCLVGISTAIKAETNKVPEPFRGHDDNSVLSISYEDYSAILNISVLNMGKSKRQKAHKSKASIGSRLKSNRKVFTALEGNRFFFKNFTKPENKAVLTKIRKSLEQVPDEAPMKLLNYREQLAYWLNLYNIALLEQIIDIYPKSSLEDWLYEDDGILNKKFLTVSGIPLSLNDIQFNIIFEKFPNTPLVMYGLSQGIIGGPNILKRAYTGKTVVQQLTENAKEFINSNRGTSKGKKGVFRVSSLYERNSQLFPNFKDDLKTHLLEYLDGRYTYLLRSSKKIKANISDTNINDIMGGERQFSGSANTNNAAMLDSVGPTEFNGVAGAAGGETELALGISNPALLSSSYQNINKSYGRFSPETIKMLTKLNNKRLESKGTVIIKEDKKDDNK